MTTLFAWALPWNYCWVLTRPHWAVMQMRRTSDLEMPISANRGCRIRLTRADNTATAQVDRESYLGK
jgi:hypothetical protein